MIRRQFLRFAAGGVAGAATSRLTVEALSRFNASLQAEERRVPGGPERFATAVCSMCPGGCGMKVRLVGDRAVKIQGNRLSPINRGGLCPRGLSALQELYHPDRLRKPLQNIGSRRSPKWRDISWDAAISTIANRLAQLRAGRQASSVAVVGRQERTLHRDLFRKFLRAYGSHHDCALPSGLDSVQSALYFQQGVTAPVAYDLENSRYVMSFGADLLEGWASPVSVMRAFGRWRDAFSGRRTKFVQVDPRLSLTAARADEWLPIRPGTEAALALGIAYVLITEALYDAAFVRDYTFGFEDWRDDAGKTHTGFRSLVLGEYRLNDVAELTGIPADRILRVAREFGGNRPSLAIGDRQTSTLPGDPYAAMAVHSLNALAGSIDRAGGVVLQPALPAAEAENTFAGAGYAFGGGWTALLERMESGKPEPIRALFLRQVDPVFTAPAGDVFRRALENVPFVAAFSAFPDESSSIADLVLPATTALESWTESGPPPVFPHAVVSVAPPAVPARFQSRDPGDVILAIARKLGGDVAAKLPYDSFEAYARHCAGELSDLRQGTVFSTGLEDSWNRMLERSGWWAPTWSKADELWEQMQENGGWWDPANGYGDLKQALKTPSGKFEFFSQRLAAAAGGARLANHVGLAADDDRLCLPHQPPLPEKPAGYPLLLLPVEQLALAGGSGSHLPYLQQIAGPHVAASWDSWLEIHPETAKKLGIGDGDMVWVESRRGRARVRARLYEGAAPGAVHLPLGYGQAVGSDWSRRGVNPLALIETVFEPLAGLPQTGRTHVKVYRA